MADRALCKIQDCDKPVHQRGMCTSHYFRNRRHGDPLGGGTGKGRLREYLDTVVFPHRSDECHIWPFARSAKGYATIKVDGATLWVSRLVCEEINGPPPTGKHEAAHTCGRGSAGCVSPQHLVWKTTSENHADKVLHGTDNRGEKNPLAKLTRDEVRAIRAIDERARLADIAERFGVSKTTVSRIRRRVLWHWLE